MPNKAFQEVTLLTRKPGQMRVVSSLAGAAEFILKDWPFDDSGPELDRAKHDLLRAYEGEITPGAARVSLVKAAKVAQIYIQPAGRSLVAGRPSPKWGKRKPTRRP